MCAPAADVRACCWYHCRVQALTAAVNKITAALCDDGGDCSVTLPSCKPSEAEAGADDANMVVDWAGDHGKDVPVGVVASRTPSP